MPLPNSSPKTPSLPSPAFPTCSAAVGAAVVSAARRRPPNSSEPAVATGKSGWFFGRSKLETAKIRCTHHQFGFGETGIAKEKPGRIIYHQPRSLHFISEPIPWIYHSYRLPALFLVPSNKGNSMTLKSPLPNLITFKGHPAELVGKLMAVPNVSAFRMNGINHLTLPGS